MSADEGAGDTAERLTVFLSYARADQETAQRLVTALQAAGVKLWWDALIEGGAEFAKSIERALADCDAVIVLWSAASVQSDWVRDEAAQGRDRRKLVPISLDGTVPPLGFGQYHAINFAQWRGATDAPEISSLLRAVAASVTSSAATSSAATRAAGPTGMLSPAATMQSRRRLLLGAGAVAVAGAAGYWAWQQGLLGGRQLLANSIAVLPFENLSGDPHQAYFSDGLAEEVRATLARNDRLLVMAPTSAGKFRDRTEDATSIATKLGVAYLLEGSVRRSNDLVRVVSELIDGHSGFSRWSQTFDRKLTDIFAVQSEIAGTVARALASRVSGQSAQTVAAASATLGGTASVSAYDAYLRGRALYDLSADEDSERAALAQFDAAIAVDPNYAAAYAARSRSLTAIANQYGQVDQLATLYGAAVAAAEKAVAIAPELADAHSTLGFVLFQGTLDARAARVPFDRSRALGAGDAAVMARYAQYCSRVGRTAEAAEAIQRALTLDPLNPLIYRAAGLIEYAARHYAAALQPLQRALSMNPKMSRTHAAVGDALFMLGRLAEAREAYAAEPVEDFSLSGKAIIERRLGRSEVAQAALHKLVADQGDRVLYQQAQVLAQWGERDTAIAALQRARALGDSGLIYARNDPLLDGLRADPRFTVLLHSMGFD